MLVKEVLFKKWHSFHQHVIFLMSFELPLTLPSIKLKLNQKLPHSRDEKFLQGPLRQTAVRGSRILVYGVDQYQRCR